MIKLSLYSIGKIYKTNVHPYYLFCSGLARALNTFSMLASRLDCSILLPRKIISSRFLGGCRGKTRKWIIGAEAYPDQENASAASWALATIAPNGVIVMGTHLFG